ncbi:L-histidine N(alpha)-methyltransferase [Thalassoglobus sp.]|uniref:L-histidine N(alpha)-methyltransferase n=1 Tax=Thalassoglobus sp. TaxID=2795869 RepID=UPI003AA8BD1F
MSEQTSATESGRQFFADVVHGLSLPGKSIPSKYFYDERGSALFDQICDTEEYYPTRAELEILQHNTESIAYQVDRGVMLVEYGSGSSVKTRLLLDSLNEPAAYVPVDISEEHLLKTAEELRLGFPQLAVLPVVADFTKPFALPTGDYGQTHVALYFPGSTIGNFTPAEAGELLEMMAGLLGTQGGLLIGIDLQKEISVIESAYNDRDGVTADFNLNLLRRINTELNADFNLDQFEHRAIYNMVHHRIEMSLVSQCDQSVSVGGRRFEFRRSEQILTEYSHKYTVEGFARFASQYGFSLHRHWTDSKEHFAVLHLVIEQELVV